MSSKIFMVGFIDALVKGLEMSTADFDEIRIVEDALDGILDDTGFNPDIFEKIMEDWAIRVATMAAARAKSGH